MIIEIRTDDGEVIRQIHVPDNEEGAGSWDRLHQQVENWIKKFQAIIAAISNSDIEWDR